MTPWRVLGVLVLGMLVVGCVDDPSPSYEVSGTFTENATQEQMNELGQQVEQEGGHFAQLESFPVQFRATQLTASGCDEIVSFVEGAEYVAEHGACQLSSSG